MSINTGDTAWLLMSSALVMLMTPGLALFYGGMVRRKNLLSTMMMRFGCLGLAALLLVPYGPPFYRRRRREGQVQRPARFFRFMADSRLRPRGALGLGQRRLAR